MKREREQEAEDMNGVTKTKRHLAWPRLKLNLDGVDKLAPRRSCKLLPLFLLHIYFVIFINKVLL